MHVDKILALFFCFLSIKILWEVSLLSKKMCLSYNVSVKSAVFYKRRSKLNSQKVNKSEFLLNIIAKSKNYLLNVNHFVVSLTSYLLRIKN